MTLKLMSRRTLIRVFAVIVVGGLAIAYIHKRNQKEREEARLTLHRLRAGLAKEDYEIAYQLMTGKWRSEHSLAALQARAGFYKDEVLKEIGVSEEISISPDGKRATVRTETQGTSGYVFYMSKEGDNWKVSFDIGVWGPSF